AAHGSIHRAARGSGGGVIFDRPAGDPLPSLALCFWRSQKKRKTVFSLDGPHRLSWIYGRRCIFHVLGLSACGPVPFDPEIPTHRPHAFRGSLSEVFHFVSPRLRDSLPVTLGAASFSQIGNLESGCSHAKQEDFLFRHLS